MVPISQVVLAAGYMISQKGLGVWGNAGMLVFLVTDMVLSYTVLRGRKKDQLQREVEEFRFLQETESARREMLEEKEQELLELNRNFEIQLQNIRRKMECGDTAKTEMDSLQKELDATRPEEYCQNKIVNAVMSEKVRQCKMKKIECNAELIVPGDLRMDPLHICSLFSNLLDNAIEAVSEEMQQTDRWIKISTEVKGVYAIIKISNPAVPAHVTRVKRDGHGYGTKIIADIVKQYDGIYQTEYKQEIYTVTLGIKIR